MNVVILGKNGEPLAPVAERLGEASARSGDLGLTVINHGAGLQVIGRQEQGSATVSLEIQHQPGCGAKSVEVEIVAGSALITVVDATGERREIAHVARPWAFDGDGRSLTTWFEARGDRLVQHVDATGRRGAITFDPSYSSIPCTNGYWADAGASAYLSMDSNDNPPCPPYGMFFSANGYYPVLGHDPTVANDGHSWVTVKIDGECSWMPDTGWAWDFQIPCKAHDYCYDLRRAGFSGTVPDQDCDDEFFWLMEANCNNQTFESDCRAVRDNAMAFVRPAVRHADPGVVFIKVNHSGQCLDVAGASLNEGTPVVQYPCHYMTHQQYRIWPAPNDPGKFNIKPVHSGMCVDGYATGISQWECAWPDDQAFRINGAFVLNQYTIWTKSSGYTKCFDVPWSSQDPGIQVEQYWCNETANQIWRII